MAGDAHDAGTVDLTIRTQTNTLNSGDILNLNDQGDAGSFTYDLDATTFSRTGTAVVTYMTIETINLQASVGSATVNVTSTAASANTNITTQDAADTMTITTTGDMSNVVVNTAGGDDLITITSTGTGSFLVVNAGARADTLTQDGNGSASRVQLNGDAGVDTFFIRAATASSLTDINGGAGTDQISLGSLVNSLSDLDGDIFVAGDGQDAGNSSLTIRGESNVLPSGDFLNLNDQGDAGSFDYDLNATTFTRTGMDGMVDYVTVETVNLNTSMGATNILDVASTPDSVNTNIVSQGGNDNMVIRSTGDNSNTTVSSLAGSDTITVETTGADSFLIIESGTGSDMLTQVANGVGSRVQWIGTAGQNEIWVQTTAVMSLTDVVGGSGTDNIAIGNASNSLADVDGDIFVAGNDHDAGVSSLTIKGDTNTLESGDILSFLDQGDAGSHSYNLDATTFSRSGMDGTVNFAGTGVVSVETINLSTSEGATSALVVNDTPANINVNIATQSGNDDVRIVDTGANSNLELQTSDGDDSIDVELTGDNSFLIVSVGDSSQAASIDVDPAELVQLRMNGLASHVELNGEGGDDLLIVNATSASSITQLNGGPHNDTFRLGSAAPSEGTLDTLRGMLCIDGGAHDATRTDVSTVGPTMLEDPTVNDPLANLNPGDVVPIANGDLIEVHDQLELDNQNYSINSELVSRDNGAGLVVSFSYGEIERLQLDTGQGDDVVNVDMRMGSQLPSIVAVADAAGNDGLIIDGSEEEDNISVGNDLRQGPFAIDGVECMWLIGRDGDDHLTNTTDSDSRQEGNEGNDRMQGGSGVDAQYGGAGSDFLFAGDGDDFLFPDNDFLTDQQLGIDENGNKVTDDVPDIDFLFETARP